ncbi:hypothetical protein HMPREF0946_00428 [Fusobacterium vincentii 3_1_36A2]|uniref:Uncharacterized protein n=2 Tax=Fusobacterium TaxID=848 RepID=C7XNG2_FUSVC|nr:MULTISPECIES: hypothetical protein [Fusobacterium]EEU32355.1 hypothetical protein HMPREF0946_00428 [Fusobacterium vincentii 3_1_36A2]
MLQKYLFFEILNSEDPKKYEEFKNLVNYDFLIYFTKKRENNSKIDDFNLLNSYEKIFINKFADYQKIDFVGNLSELKIGYVIEIDTNIASYLDRLYKNNLKTELNPDILRMLDDFIFKHEYFKLGYNLYIWENILKGINDSIVLDTAKSIEYSFYPQKNLIDSISLISIENEIKERIKYIKLLKNEKEKQNIPILCLLIKAFFIKKLTYNLYERIEKLVYFINEELGIYMEVETVICILYLLDNKNIEKFFKEKDIVSMSWDLSHLRFLEEIYIKKPIFKSITFPFIISSDEGLREVIKLYKIKGIYKIGTNEYDVIYEFNIEIYIEEYQGKKGFKVNKNKIKEILLQIPENTEKRKLKKVDYNRLLENLKTETNIKNF